jgi:hypothetical protein
MSSWKLFPQWLCTCNISRQKSVGQTSTRVAILQTPDGKRIALLELTAWNVQFKRQNKLLFVARLYHDTIGLSSDGREVIGSAACKSRQLAILWKRRQDLKLSFHYTLWFPLNNWHACHMIRSTKQRFDWQEAWEQKKFEMSCCQRNDSNPLARGSDFRFFRSIMHLWCTHLSPYEKECSHIKCRNLSHSTPFSFIIIIAAIFSSILLKRQRKSRFI